LQEENRSPPGRQAKSLVDEYQDVNPGQVKLIEHFVNDGVKLWVVGDDDQTLYAFRASDVRYVLEFTTTHPKAEIHVLDRNYRSWDGCEQDWVCEASALRPVAPSPPARGKSKASDRGGRSS
jgi:UvrD/REP helicase N-terminal domain